MVAQSVWAGMGRRCNMQHAQTVAGLLSCLVHDQLTSAAP